MQTAHLGGGTAHRAYMDWHTSGSVQEVQDRVKLLEKSTGMAAIAVSMSGSNRWTIQMRSEVLPSLSQAMSALALAQDEAFKAYLFVDSLQALPDDGCDPPSAPPRLPGLDSGAAQPLQTQRLGAD